MRACFVRTSGPAESTSASSVPSKDAPYVIDTQLASMCTSLYDYMQKVPPIPDFDDVQQCVGYKVHDAIDCTAVDGRTA